MDDAKIRRIRKVNCRNRKNLRKDPKKLTNWVWAVNKQNEKAN